MWKPKSFSQTVFPIYLINLFFGCSLIYYPRDRLRLGWSICYTIFHIVTYFTSLYYTLFYALSAPWFKPAEKIFSIVLYVHCCVMIVNMVMIYFHRKTTFRVVNTANEVHKCLNSLGGNNTYHQRLFIEILGSIGVWFLGGILTSTASMVYLSKDMSFIRSLIFVNILLYPIHINSLCDFNFCIRSRLIGMSLEIVNQLLDAIVIKEEEIKKCMRSNQRNNAFFIISVLPKKKPHLMYGYDSLSTIQVLKQIHREIGMLSNCVTKNHGIQLTMSVIALYVMIIGYTYEIYIVWMDLSSGSESKLVRIICLIVWVLVSILKFVMMNYKCDDTVAQYKRTSEIIHRLDIFNRDDEFRDEIRQFSIQITQNKLCFQPCGLFTLGFGFARSFIASATTNLIILIQMSGVSRK